MSNSAYCPLYRCKKACSRFKSHMVSFTSWCLFLNNDKWKSYLNHKNKYFKMIYLFFLIEVCPDDKFLMFSLLQIWLAGILCQGINNIYFFSNFNSLFILNLINFNPHFVNKLKIQSMIFDNQIDNLKPYFIPSESFNTKIIDYKKPVSIFKTSPHWNDYFVPKKTVLFDGFKCQTKFISIRLNFTQKHLKKY